MLYSHGWILVAFAMAVVMTGLEAARPLHGRPFRTRLRRLAAHAVLMTLNLVLLIALAWALEPIQLTLAEWGYSGPLLGMHVVPASILGFLLMDLCDYGFHRLKHTRWLWPMHRLHHDDREMDWTTRFRFHPLEAVADELLRFSLAVLLGVPPVGLVSHKVVNHVHAQFEHGNVRWPRWMEPVLGWLIITPGQHRVHHSREPVEGQSNFGARLSIWDRVFGTLRTRPAWEEVETGVDTPEARSLLRMLADPAAAAGLLRDASPTEENVAEPFRPSIAPRADE